MLGTPHYIAPEQTVSPQKADIRADIYSLGCTLYCLLTGHPPFDAPSLYELLQAHHSMDAKPLNFIRPEVPVELAAVVAKMLAKEPERRFQTHAEVAEALKPFFRKDGVNSKALKPEVSQVGLVDPKQEPVKVPTPATQPQPKADANPAPGQTAAGSRAEPKWESLIDIKETEDAQDVVAVVFQPKRQWPRWFWPAIAGAFSFAMIALGIVIYFTTDKGRIKVDLGDGKTPVKVEPGGGVVVEFEPAAKDRTLANQNTSTTKNAEIAATAKSDEPITNSIGMKLVLIPAGDFFMGSPEGDIEARGEEKPAHRVRISKPFYLGVYEVTQAQYEAVMRYNPSHFSSNGGGKDLVAGQSTDRYPVENVPWLDAVTFCNKLSEREGRKSSYEIDGENVRVPDRNGSGYRLPTEAEWEYACRANASTPTRYSFGDDAAELGEYGWFYGHSDARTHLVGQKKPNGFGLYDMHGNVWEWCWDWYSAGYYKQSPADDPTGSEPASLRVRRGGSWGHEPRWCRSAFRSQVGPGVRDRKQGFRLALYPSDKIKDQSGNMSPGLPLSNESKTAQPLGVEKLVTPRTEGPKPTPSGIESKPTLRPRGDWTSPTTKRDCSIATGADSKIARQEQGESTWDPLNASELAPNSANGLMPSLIAWAKSQPPGNVAIVSTKMEFVRIKAGEFIMGSPEPDAPPEQKPQHKVRISPFYLGIYEVTQAQYQAAMGNIPSYFSSTGGGKDKVAGRSTDQYPVEGVSWLDAVRFCNALSKKDGLTPFYEVNGRNVAIPARKGSGYRLPTEAEWEYACRAGTTTKYSFGNNPFLLGDYGWFDQNSMRMSHPVGEKHPNEFGLYDMHGNVFERCSDTYTNDYNKGAPESDPLGLPSVADLAVIRGGSWRRGERSCWSAYRYGYTQTGRQPDLGFRVALGQSGP
jgi:formylglycine-generating enzyme required for sulfatase activity